MKIGDFELGGENPCFIIAELSANHNGSIENAIETIRAAKRVGADAIKLQTYTADTMTLDVKNKYFEINHGTQWDGQYLHGLYKTAYTPWEWHEKLFQVAKEEGIICFSSPFDNSAADLLEDLEAPAYKIASFEIHDIPLIKYVASKGKPIIMSTGIASLEDIELAVQTCKDAGNHEITLLKCTSAYPAPLELANLNTIADLRERFKVEVGFSDHTYGFLAPVVACTLGAKVIEKHFILDRKIGGPDADFSLDEKEFKEMVDAVRDAEKLLGVVSYDISKKIEKNRKFGRSLFVAETVKAGEILSEDNIRSIRPGYGMAPKHYFEVLGKTFKQDVEKGTPLTPELFN
jgi:pseudaminic acid synthase